MVIGAIVDLDGTVYRGESLLPGAVDGIGQLRDADIELLFCSNNPTLTAANCVRGLAEMDPHNSAFTTGLLG